MTTDSASAHVIISGRVQGVFFRAETKRAAEKIGVAGWVRNLPDGTVEAVFEGPRPLVERAIDWCRQGSPMSRVTDIAVHWQQVSGESGTFTIRH